MKTIFQISLHMITPAGFETYGNFEVGTSQEKAEQLFNELKGSGELTEKTILCMDLTQIQDNVPLPVKLLHCTLDDIACNVKTITRHKFRNLGLEAEK